MGFSLSFLKDMMQGPARVGVCFKLTQARTIAEEPNMEPDTE